MSEKSPENKERPNASEKKPSIRSVPKATAQQLGKTALKGSKR